MANLKHTSSTYKKIYLSFLFICLIPLFILSIALYMIVYDAHKSSVLEHEKYEGERITKLLDAEFSRFHKIAIQFSTAQWVLERSFEKDNYEKKFNYAYKRALCNDLRGYVVTSNFIKSISLYFVSKEQAFSSDGFYKSDEFIRSFDYKNTSKLDEKHILHNILTTYGLVDAETLGFPATTEKFFYIESLGNNLSDKVHLIIEINLPELKNFISRYKSSNIVGISLNSTSNLPIFFSNLSPHTTFKSKHDLINTYLSSNHLISYTTYHTGLNFTLPSSQLFFIALIILITLCLSSNLALILTKSTYSPLQNLMNKIFPDPHKHFGNSEYEIIENSVQHLLHEHAHVVQKSMRYLHAAKYNFLFELLRGYFGNPHEVNEKIREFDCNFTERHYFLVTIINLPSKYHELSDQYTFIFLEKAIEKVLDHFHCHYELVQNSALQVSIIFFFSQEHFITFDVFAIETALSKLFLENYQIKVILSSGPLEEGILGISKSYCTANEHLSHYYAQKSTGILGSLTKNYYYPTDWEIQLISKLKTFQKEGALTILSELKKENEKLSLSLLEIKQLCSVIAETLSKIIHELDQPISAYTQSFDKLTALTTPEEIWHELFKITEQICSRVNTNNDQTLEDIGIQVVTYTLENITNPNLSLKALSSKFNLSVSAISKIFKKSTGINFSTFILTLRMEKAVENLTPHSNTAQLAHEIGYENEASFKRAFKRHYNCTISEYLKNIHPPINE